MLSSSMLIFENSPKDCVMKVVASALAAQINMEEPLVPLHKRAQLSFLKAKVIVVTCHYHKGLNDNSVQLDTINMMVKLSRLRCIGESP